MASLPQDSANIRPEDTSDVDSALGDDVSVLTETLRSSLFESIRENGRGYHRYSSTVGQDYPIPEDEIEQARLDLQHEMVRRTFNGKLYLSPIKKEPHEILDLGTGTGIWAIEMADANPQAQVLGMDLSPMQPEMVPPNLKFEVDDFNDEWTYTQKFDFIHARALVGSSQDFPKLIRQAYGHLRPDGYLEMTDVQMPFMSDDRTMEGTDLETWSNRQVEACAKIGVDTTAPSKYKQMMVDAGFVDVQEYKFKWPVGTWPKDQYYKEIGKLCLINFLTGLEGFTLRCTRYTEGNPAALRQVQPEKGGICASRNVNCCFEEEGIDTTPINTATCPSAQAEPWMREIRVSDIDRADPSTVYAFDLGLFIAI